MKRALILVLAVALVGCSTGSDDEARPISGKAKRVAATIERLEAATRAGQYATICNELFSRAARERAGGRNCAKLMTATAREVQRPRISLLSIRLQGDERAEARVMTRAVGQEAIEETIRLVREGGRFRIDALG